MMPSFPGVDFLDFDSLLSDDEKLARKTARQFVDEQVLPMLVIGERITGIGAFT
jgi:glutaryl-CoA dehydrogenase